MSNTTLQTPELYEYKRAHGSNRIGSHLLLAALYDNGLVLGRRFDNRRDTELEWLIPINKAEGAFIVCWGDMADYEMLSQFIYNLAESMIETLAVHYATITFLRKRMLKILKDQFSNGSLPLAIDSLFIDATKNELMFVNFAGEMMGLSRFGVLGGYPYPTVHEIKAGDKTQKAIKLEYPLKLALKQLTTFYHDRKSINRKQTIDVVTNTLFACDPPSKQEKFEIAHFEKGEWHVKYVKRPFKPNQLGVPLDEMEQSFLPEAFSEGR
jgi:hypothetical protein